MSWLNLEVARIGQLKFTVIMQDALLVLHCSVMVCSFSSGEDDTKWGEVSPVRFQGNIP